MNYRMSVLFFLSYQNDCSEILKFGKGKAMARQREFNPIDLINKATDLFWRKGFLATSMDDLVKATGVNRYGIYSAYSDKRGIFLAALDNFSSCYVNGLLSELEQDSASLEEIRGYFQKVVAAAGSEQGRLGCLMCSSSNEIFGLDPAIDEKMVSHFKRLKQAFQRALTNASNNRELELDSSETVRLADYLVGLAHGCSSLNRSGASKRAVKNFVDTGMTLLR